jgi:hypothetical protein
LLYIPKLPSANANKNTSPLALFFAGNACMQVTAASSFSTWTEFLNQAKMMEETRTSPPQSPDAVHLHTVLSSPAESTSPDDVQAMPVAADQGLEHSDAGANTSDELLVLRRGCACDAEPHCG